MSGDMPDVIRHQGGWEIPSARVQSVPACSTGKRDREHVQPVRSLRAENIVKRIECSSVLCPLTTPD